MALFGDLGKVIGLDKVDTGDLLSVAGTAAGFYFGGPAGASLGAGIGGLAGGKSVNEALTNAALAYGVTSFISPTAAQNMGLQKQGVSPGFLQNKLYGVETSAANSAAGGIDQAVNESTKKGLFDNLDMSDALLGIGAVGALSGINQKQEEGTPRAQPVGEAFGQVVGPFSNRTYNLDTPSDVLAYNEEVKEYQKDDFDYRTPPKGYKDGGEYDRNNALGEVTGPGTGTSDSVNAKLSDGEFVLTARAVRGAGGGDRDIGAARLYDMMSELEATA